MQVSTDIVVPYLDWLQSKIYGADAQHDIYKAPFAYKNTLESELKGVFGQSMPADVLKIPMIDGMLSLTLLSELTILQLKYIRDYTLNNIDYSVLSPGTKSDFEAIKAVPDNPIYKIDKIKTAKEVVKIFQDTFDDYLASADVELLAAVQNSDNLL